VVFDPAYVEWFTLSFPTCTYCCPWLLDMRFVDDAEMTPGSRIFIGEGVWNAFCFGHEGCEPPTFVAMTFSEVPGACDSSEMALSFLCAVTPDVSHSWGCVKVRYR
jgi:hypothetical protein